MNMFEGKQFKKNDLEFNKKKSSPLFIKRSKKQADNHNNCEVNINRFFLFCQSRFLKSRKNSE